MNSTAGAIEADEPATRLRVLVAEDDPAALSLTVELVELLGHWAVGVTSAEAAHVRFIEGAFDVLLLDVNLPGLSGLDLARKLVRRERLPVIFASGEAASYLDADAVWLRKPFTSEQLQQALLQSRRRTRRD